MKQKGFSALYTLILFSFLCSIATANEQVPTYRIGAGDVLEISVWKDEYLTRRLTIPPDGNFAFPLIEEINVNNMTTMDLRKSLTKKISEFIPNATVTVMVVEFNSLKAYVIGKVNRPGVSPITLDTTVMQVLAMAGGLNPFASEKKIHILRQENNKTVKLPFNYKEVLKGENLEQNIILKRGDVIVVP